MANINDKKEYEISFVVKQKDGEGVVDGLLKQHGAEVVFRGPVTETRLSYPIKKFHQAYFGYMHFIAAADVVEKLVHDANLNPAILRVLVVTPPVGKGTQAPRKERTERPAKKMTETAAPVGGILTNEALEEKLEEILK
ncbi:30S ribosomal protein S6 [Patescibacteria group bacterium]|nr:30S ribosomal protein S6 [Patescibacteria group bacterium]